MRDITAEQEIERQTAQQERLASVGRLAAGIAHDFNNILAVITLYADLASRRLRSNARAQEYLDIVQKQARQASDLIQQILDFSRQSELTRHPLSLLPYLEELLKLWDRILPKTVKVQLTHDDGRLRVNADPARIQQALMNLATNARDAMPEGGMIHIEVQEVTFTADDVPVPDMAAGRWVELRFQDTGVGMAPEILDHAFEPFHTTKETGTGLGLAQVYGIVKQHGGEITIQSEMGTGTTVVLYLPVVADLSPDAAHETAPGAPTQGRGQRILVVEDNAETRGALIAALRSLDYGTVEASNGREALEILAAEGDRIDLILSDAVMPVMGLRRLLSALVEQGYTQPVIAVSGYLEPEEKARLRKADELATLLIKPFGLQELASAIETALASE